MGSRAVSAFVAALLMVPALASPALAYYPDDHIWDREYQSGVEWNYPAHKAVMPWISSTAWRTMYPTAPAWWQTYAYSAWAPNYAAMPTAYLPVSQQWTSYTNSYSRAWDTMTWNVAWWDGSYRPVNNVAYSQGMGAYTASGGDRLNAELAVAAAYGDLYRVKALVGSGADINARDYEGYTALTWAAQHGRREVVDYLLGRYAQPNARDRWGYTPLMWAVQQGHTEVAGMLLAKGANPRVSTPYGVTPHVLSMYAAGGRSRPLVEAALAGQSIAYGNYYRGVAAGNTWQAAQSAPMWTGQYTTQTMPATPSWNVMGTMGMPMTAQQGWSGTAAPPQALMGNTGAQGWSGTVAPQALAGNNGASPVTAGVAANPVARLDATAGWTKVGALAADFGLDYKNYLSESTKGGLSLSSLGAVTNPDTYVGKDLSQLFINVARDRDLKQARTNLEGVKTQAKGSSRFQKYINVLDETLRGMGF